ncbi:MAG: hypothetical protein ACTHV2_10955 [Brachybacterium sp.]
MLTPHLGLAQQLRELQIGADGVAGLRTGGAAQLTDCHSRLLYLDDSAEEKYWVRPHSRAVPAA